MKKLLYIPAVIFGLHAAISAVMAVYFLMHNASGDAALAIVFTFTGTFASGIMVAIAQS